MSERSIFLEALERPDPAERREYLESACGDDAALLRRVEQLLAAHDADGGVLDRPPGPDEGTGPYQPPETASTWVGPYKLLQRLGEGGMGTVWMAEQQRPVKRRVALKVIKAGMGGAHALARFEAERQALAMMDHPNIAKVLDAGTTENGQPYFVMELVKGVPITQYCDQMQLTPRERLGLFIPVCHAVQHAHQKGVIHRDIKPSNVIVALYDGVPVPKVIDFGVAKALHQKLTEKTMFTEVGQVVGTLEYMAPEQAELNNLDIDTRADIYSLGVLLYELLTGEPPFTARQLRGAAFADMLRMIREAEPPKPSTRLSSSAELPSIAAKRKLEPKRLTRLVRGDLDWVVMKCLEKERSRRYETANGLSLDLQRHLDGEAVLAGPPTLRYRLGKFVRRHRAGVWAAGGIAGLLVALITVLSVGLYRLDRANRDTEAALERESKARRQARQALDDLTSQVVEDWLGQQPQLFEHHRAFLRRAAEQYREFAEGQPADRAARFDHQNAWRRLGHIYKALGDKPEAEAAFRQAADLGEALLAEEADASAGRVFVQALNNLGDVLSTQQHLREAEAVLRRGLATVNRLPAEVQEDPVVRDGLVHLHNNLGNVLSDQNRRAEGLEEHLRAVQVRRQLVEDFPRNATYLRRLGTNYQNVSASYSRLNRLAEAEEAATEAVTVARAACVALPNSSQAKSSLAFTLSNLGMVLRQRNAPERAAPLLREGVKIQTELSAHFPSIPEHALRLAELHHHLGLVLHDRQRFAEALSEYRQSLKFLDRLVGDFPNVVEFHIARAETCSGLADVHVYMNHHREYEAYAREAVKEWETTERLRPDETRFRVHSADASCILANALNDLGNLGEGEAVARKAYQSLKALHAAAPDGRHRQSFAWSAFILGKVLVYRGEYPQAAGPLIQAADEYTDLAKDSPNEPMFTERLGLAAVLLSRLRLLEGDFAMAEDWAGQAVTRFTDLRKDYPEKSAVSRFLLDAYWHRAESRVKLGRYREAAEDWGQTVSLDQLGDDRPWFRAHQAEALHRAGEVEKAAALFATAVKEVEPRLDQEGLSGMILYDTAAVYALAAGADGDRQEAERLAAQAVRLLTRAAQVGYFQDSAMVATLGKNEDFRSLRDRDGYVRLLESLPAGPTGGN